MSFAIIRAKKYKTGQHIRAVANHNFRIPPTKPPKNPKEKPKFDASKSHLNVHIGAQNPDEEMVAIRERIKICTRKPRPDANKIVEFVMTASPEFFKDQPDEFAKKYLNDCMEFAGMEFGPDNIVSAQMHFDEKTPHIHIKAVPLETSVRKTKHKSSTQTVLNAKFYTNGHAKMIELQDKFYAFIKERGHDLERGISKSITKAEHQETADWYEKEDARLTQERGELATLKSEAEATIEQATDRERKANEAMASLLEVKKANAVEAKKAQELNDDTRRREAQLAKDKEAYTLHAKTLNDSIKANNKRADTVKELLEVKTLVSDPMVMQVVQCIKSNPQAKDIVLNVSRMDQTALDMLRPLSDDFANASQGLQVVDRTQEDWTKVLEPHPLFESQDYRMR